MKYLPIPTLLALISTTTTTTVVAFSSIAVPPPPITQPPAIPQTVVAEAKDTAASTTTSRSSSSWRVVLDIGREPLANGMPFDWARSGCRMPLVIPCEFSASKSSTQSKLVEPTSSTVSFTGPDGAVVKPVDGGEWNISMEGKNNKSPSSLQFSLTFPETLARRDVTIDGGTTLQCVGTIYTQEMLDDLNAAYYEARQETWRIGGELNDAVSKQGGPKKWNEEQQRWEKPENQENPFQWAQKRLSYWAAKAKQDQMNKQRPNVNKLSERGSFPDIDDRIYVSKEGGLVKNQNGAVMGTWYAEPINDQPVSYYRN